MLLYLEDHSDLCGSGHGRLGALLRRHRAEQVAAVGDELGAGREAGLVGGDEKHQLRDLVRLGDARNRQAPCRQANAASATGNQCNFAFQLVQVFLSSHLAEGTDRSQN